MDNWKYLNRLLEQDQFEVVDFEHLTPYEDGTDCRVIYLMNDAVESFLVFRNARYTGEYIEGYDGKLEYVLAPDENCIRIHQGSHHFLLFFDVLDLEMHLYDYGMVGHFWVKGCENLRVLEYQISIVADKLEYLGEDACNELERRIASLKRFPPLNYTCYPSALEAYIVPMEHPWEAAEEAIGFMEEICADVQDFRMIRVLEAYRRRPTRRKAKRIARKLARAGHRGVSERLRELMVQASADYARRSYGAEMERSAERMLEWADEMRKSCLAKGMMAHVYREEPFIHVCDEMQFQVYLMIMTSRRSAPCKVFRICENGAAPLTFPRIK